MHESSWHQCKEFQYARRTHARTCQKGTLKTGVAEDDDARDGPRTLDEGCDIACVSDGKHFPHVSEVIAAITGARCRYGRVALAYALPCLEGAVDQLRHLVVRFDLQAIAVPVAIAVSRRLSGAACSMPAEPNPMHDRDRSSSATTRPKRRRCMTRSCFSRNRIATWT